jgi:2-keto-4-pentenoate hydratase
MTQQHKSLSNSKPYNAVLKAQDSLTIWLDKRMTWLAAVSGKRGRRPKFSDTGTHFFDAQNLLGLTTGLPVSVLQIRNTQKTALVHSFNSDMLWNPSAQCGHPPLESQSRSGFAMIRAMSTESSKDCATGFCAPTARPAGGPSPFANQPPVGMSLLAKDDPEDVLPDWPIVAPQLPEDAYSIADALWWCHKLGERSAKGADVAYMLRDAADARAVQNALALARQWWPANTVPRYWKSGGPTRDAATLIHAPLPETGIQTDVSTATSPAQVFSLRGVEGEIALRIKHDVTAEQAAALTPATAADLIDAYAVAIEFVDSRWREGTQAPALTLLADGQCHGGLALSAWQDFAPLRNHDWSQQLCTLQINDGAAQSFTGTHSLQDPTWLLADWLQHVTTHYGTVTAGTVVTTGTWTGCPEVQAGDLVTVSFEGLGKVRWQF